MSCLLDFVDDGHQMCVRMYCNLLQNQCDPEAESAGPHLTSPALTLSVSLLRLMRKPALATASMRRDASVVFRAWTLGSGTFSSLKGTSLASTLTRLTYKFGSLPATKHRYASIKRCRHLDLILGQIAGQPDWLEKFLS